MKVLFCWTDISGYMAACWRALASREGVDLHVLAYDSSAATEGGRRDLLTDGRPIGSRASPLRR